MQDHDSTQETLAHIRRVQECLGEFTQRLFQRGVVHDKSKLEEPEKQGFDRVTGALRGLTYGSPEYKAQLEQLKPILEHHYANNSHHPEHHRRQVCIICFSAYPMSFQENCSTCRNGQMSIEWDISGMSLLDLIEMFCDWKAATERHADGSLERSIQVNKDRFVIAPQLAIMFENTRKELGWK